MCVGGPRPGYPPLYPTSPYGFSQPPPGIFPANINSMHVSLSGPNDGLSLTIETSQHGRADTEYSGAPGPSWHCREEANNVKKQKRHHQQSRTIFRCVSSMTLNILHDLYQTIFFPELFCKFQCRFLIHLLTGENLERDCDSRSTESSQLSDYSALGERERARHVSNTDYEVGN